MDILPVGTKIWRSYDGVVYWKNKATDDIKKPAPWTSGKSTIYVSDVAIQSNYKLYRNITRP